MDIHAPMEPVHSWKDIAIHLSIMTIGLFIALMLEAGVEYWHHRHIVAEARANIRQEIEENHEAAQKDVVYLDQAIKLVDGNVKTIHVMSQHPKNFHGSLENTMEFDSFDDAAWHTARDTGALSYMPYAEVERYSELYMLEDVVNQRATAAAQQSFDALAPVYMGYDVDALPPEEYTDMLRGNAVARVDMQTLQQFVRQFDQLAEKELKQ
jgi:hypothetical protein